jgi:hypothetical protein
MGPLSDRDTTSQAAAVATHYIPSHTKLRPFCVCPLMRTTGRSVTSGRHDDAAALRPKVDRVALMALARDLPAAWNAPSTDARTKQRITQS